jgi:hypothetical protein
MQIVWPEYLVTLRDLSVGGNAIGLSLGVLLWLFGWLGHRFWIVLLATAGAGILGLYLNPVFGPSSLLIGLLLAASGGMLALSLVRVVAFAAGGLALWLGVRAWAPAWNEPLVCFLIGGLVGVCLFRVWTMALTSALGTLFMAYFGLSLAERLAKLDVPAFLEKRNLLLNWSILGVALVGFGLQLLLDRWRRRRRQIVVVETAADDEEDKSRQKAGRKPYRRAG